MAQQFGIGAGRVLLRCIGELTEENSNERSSPAAEAGLLLIRCVAFGPAADEESFDLLVYRPMFYLICGRVRSIPGHGRDPQRGSNHPNSREHPTELPQVRCRPPRKAGQEAGGAWRFFRWQPDFLGAKTPVSGLCLVHHPLPGEGGAPDLLGLGLLKLKCDNPWFMGQGLKAQQKLQVIMHGLDLILWNNPWLMGVKAKQKLPSRHGSDLKASRSCLLMVGT